jgi:hypothetical protein
MPLKDPEARAAYNAGRYGLQREARLVDQKLRDDAQRTHVRARVRKAHRLRRGIVDATSELRAGPCELCGAYTDPLHLDHDHKTGRVRGWLCLLCNTALGRFKDDPALLRRAAEYLEKHHGGAATHIE